MSKRAVVTGIGVVSSIGCAREAFSAGLRSGRCGIVGFGNSGKGSANVRLGGLVSDFAWREQIKELATGEVSARALKVLNNTTESTRWSACAALQAWNQAGLATRSNPEETALIVGGNNLSQAYFAENWRTFSAPGGRFNPRYGLSFLDTNQLGCLSEMLGLRGIGWTVGAASASGNAALFQAFHGIRSGMFRRCLVVGAGSEFSALELEALALIGAPYTGPVDQPEKCCRPFDQRHQGFVWGEGAAALVLENGDDLIAEGRIGLGEIAGAALRLDARHTPDPSVEGESGVMREALAQAGVTPVQVGMVNAHGTGAPLGDRTECAAIREIFGTGADGPRINATKALTGHGLGASGVMEAAACLIQMNGGFLHPNINLEQPIDPHLRFAGTQSEPWQGEYAVSNGFGFGGINSSLVLRRGDD